DEEDYSDADDVSWKVRRTSAKLLASIISTRSDLISEFFSELAPTLITRFKEREESVRVEVFQSFIALIRQVGAASGASISHSKKENWRNASHTSLEADPRVHLQEQIPKICKYLPKQLSGKSVSTRQTGYVLLRELVVILQGGLDEKLGLFVPTIEASLLSNSPVASVKVINNPNLKIEVLQFLQAVLSTHSPSTLEAFLPRLVKSTVAATQEKFYKITSEALLVLIELIKTVRPIPDGAVSVAPASPQSVSTIQDIYKVVLSTAKMTDVDLEVKERSIMALATLLSQAGELLTKLQVEEEALALLADRLRSEVTRLVALRAIKSVTDSVLVLTGSLKLGDFPSELLPTVGSFLRKSQRSLRMASLAALESMIRQAPTIDRGVLEEVFTEIKGLLTTEPDVHVFPLAINVVSAALAAESIRPAAVELARRDMLPTVIQLTFESPQLVGLGVGLDGVRQFWSDLAAADPNIFDSAVSAVTSPLLSNPASVAKQSYRPLAESIAVLAIAVPTLSAGTVNDFVERIAKGVQGDVALLNIDISATYSSLDQNLIALFAAQQEEIKLAAAFALGNVAVGNLARHVPLLLSQMREGGKKRYLVLMALKEVIARSPGGALAAHAAELWELLFSSAQDTTMEESTRSVVAECLAKLLVLDPASRLAPLQKQLDSPSAEVRATVVSAIRHTLTDQSAGEDFDTLLAPSIVDFLRIDDSELNVRQTSLATLNSAAHNKPYLIRSGLTQLLPRLYQETVVKQELIHVVEMGPFKHRVDDGMEARKSAFECMYTLLEKCLARIELSAYVDRVLAGLSDPAQDIKELNHLVLQRLARVAPAALTARLDEAAGPLREAVDAKPKSNAVKQEIEKVMELVRSGVRTVLVLARALGLAAASAAASAPASAAAAAATIPTSPAGGGGVAAASDAATAAAAPLFEELLRSVRTPGGPIYDVYAAVASDLDAQAAQAGGRFVG
ncbi:Cullin-associated NEDD8-dissociated protein 2, partial [Cladochytrium tenue]